MAEAVQSGKTKKPIQRSLSAIRRHRKSLRRKARNRAARTTFRGAVRDVRTAIAAKKVDEAKKGLVVAMSLLMRAASKGVVHRRTASRLISRLSSQVHRLSAAPSAPAA